MSLAWHRISTQLIFATVNIIIIIIIITGWKPCSLIQFSAAWQSYGQFLTFTVLLMFLNIFKKEEMPAFLGKH